MELLSEVQQIPEGPWTKRVDVSLLTKQHRFNMGCRTFKGLLDLSRA